MKVASRTPTHLFTDTANVQRKSAASVDGRYPAESWSTVISEMACAIQPMKTSRANLYGSERAPHMRTVFCDPSNNVKAEDRLQIIDNRTGSDVTRYFIVRSAPVDLVKGDAVLELDCEAVEGVTQ